MKKKSKRRDGDFEEFCKQIQFTPTTVFVDSTGNVVGDAILTAMDSETLPQTYKEGVNRALKAVGKPEI